MQGFLEMVSLLWATGPNGKKFEGGEKCKDFSQMVLLLWATGPQMEEVEGGEKCKDFSKWFHCYGQPTQMEMKRVLKKVGL